MADESITNERWTLRQAAERTGRSVTTLRRYIRSGRLPAEKRRGRYGPEYTLCWRDLAEAGLASANGGGALTVRPPRRSTLAAPRDEVPAYLYQELQMKHEQLLVQYGMMRAAGLKALEIQERLAARERELEGERAENRRLRAKLRAEITRLTRRLREAELDREGRELETAALRKKVRGLEMLTRNAVTSESIQRQFARLLEQSRKVRGMGPPNGARRAPAPDESADH